MVNMFYLIKKKVLLEYFYKKILSKDLHELNDYLKEDEFHKKAKWRNVKHFLLCLFYFI